MYVSVCCCMHSGVCILMENPGLTVDLFRYHSLPYFLKQAPSWNPELSNSAQNTREQALRTLLFCLCFAGSVGRAWLCMQGLPLVQQEHCKPYHLPSPVRSTLMECLSYTQLKFYTLTHLILRKCHKTATHMSTQRL